VKEQLKAFDGAEDGWIVQKGEMELRCKLCNKGPFNNVETYNQHISGKWHVFNMDQTRPTKVAFDLNFIEEGCTLLFRFKHFVKRFNRKDLESLNKDNLFTAQLMYFYIDYMVLFSRIVI